MRRRAPAPFPSLLPRRRSLVRRHVLHGGSAALSAEATFLADVCRPRRAVSPPPLSPPRPCPRRRPPRPCPRRPRPRATAPHPWPGLVRATSTAEATNGPRRALALFVPPRRPRGRPAAAVPRSRGGRATPPPTPPLTTPPLAVPASAVRPARVRHDGEVAPAASFRPRSMVAPAPRDLGQAGGRGRLTPPPRILRSPARRQRPPPRAAPPPSRRASRAPPTPAGPSTPDGATTAPSIVRGAFGGPLSTRRVLTHLPDAAPASPLKERDAIVGGQRPSLRRSPHDRTPSFYSSAPPSVLPPPSATTGAARRRRRLSSSSGAAQRYSRGFHLNSSSYVMYIEKLFLT